MTDTETAVAGSGLSAVKALKEEKTEAEAPLVPTAPDGPPPSEASPKKNMASTSSTVDTAAEEPPAPKTDAKTKAKECLTKGFESGELEAVLKKAPAKPAEEKKEAPAEKPAEEAPAKPAEEKKEAPAEKPAEEAKPAEEKPAEKPAEEKPAEKPAEEKPAEEAKPAEEKPAEEKPAEEKPAEAPKPEEAKPAEEEKPAEAPKAEEAKPAEEEKPAEVPKPAEAPAKVTSKEMEEAKAVFDKLAGADGVVSLMEFFTASNNELLKGFDFGAAAGEDKKMTFDEFKDALVKAGKLEEAAPAKEPEPPAKVTSEELEEAKKAFEKLAGDDGKVSLMEFFKGSNSELLKGFDFGAAAGEDKTLTFDEFKDALEKAGKL